jgi:hypothetical protein
LIFFLRIKKSFFSTKKKEKEKEKFLAARHHPPPPSMDVLEMLGILRAILVQRGVNNYTLNNLKPRK